jgi:cobalt/nickel transport protein
MPGKLGSITLAHLILLLFAAPAAFGHFQVLLPDADILSGASRPLQLDIRFTHPAAGGPAMAMGNPRRFGVLFQGRHLDLSTTLIPVAIDGKRGFRGRYTPTVPADYIFYLEPEPYWEPTEEKMIIHYAKVVVDGFGAEEGWDKLVGLPVEIEPLVRPYGLWAGNVFRGVVRRNGQPVPGAIIEVEYYNDRGRLQLPAPAFTTQVLKADDRGVFCYAMPFAGWWGFAALVDGERQLANPAGKPAAVELGGLIWVHARQPELTP